MSQIALPNVRFRIASLSLTNVRVMPDGKIINNLYLFVSGNSNNRTYLPTISLYKKCMGTIHGAADKRPTIQEYVHPQVLDVLKLFIPSLVSRDNRFRDSTFRCTVIIDGPDSTSECPLPNSLT